MFHTAQYIKNTLWLGSKVSFYFLSRRLVNKEDIANSYNKVSKLYQETYLKEMHRYNDQLLDRVLSTYGNKDINVLDLAGGSGYNCNYLKKHIPHIKCTLVDASSEMLKHCKDASISCVHSGMCAYMEKQQEATFDVILCTWALMYEKPQRVLKECFRILKPSGRLYILVNDKKTLPQVRTCYPLLLIHHVQDVHTLMMDLPTPRNEKQLRTWGKQVGFTCINIYSHTHEFPFSSHQEAIQFVTSTGALAGYDVMLDLHHPIIQNDFVKLLKKHCEPCITHHFISAVFQKPEVSL